MGRPPSHLPRSLAATARSQHGCFTVAQAAMCGVPEWRVRTLIAVGVVDAVAPGVLRVTSAPRTDEQRVWAAYLAVRDPSAACAETGGWLLGWSGFVLPVLPQFAVPNQRQPGTTLADVRHLTRWETSMTPGYLLGAVGVPVLPPADVVVTIARDASAAAVLGAVQAGVFSSGLDLFDLLARTGRGIAGSARVRSAVAVYARGHDSAPELRVYVVLSGGGVGPDHTNVHLVGPAGRVGPVDGYYECGVAYEYDGRAAHRTLAQSRTDTTKRARIREQQVVVVPLDAASLAAPTRLVSLMRATVHSRSAQPAPPVVVEHSDSRSCVCGWLPANGRVPVLSPGA